METVEFNMVTTAFELPGYRIVENLGIVRGIVVRSRSIVGNIWGGVADVVRREHHALHATLRESAGRRLPADA
jgi:uncharacterized protein YbjQ (UPF0145 family)